MIFMRDLTPQEYAELNAIGLIKIDNGNVSVELCKETVHYAMARLIQGETSNFLCWVRAPQNFGERKNLTINSVLAIHGFANAFCFFCGTEKPSLYETFEIDHIKHMKEDGPDDARNAMILCTRCHKLKNWMNTYIVRHLENGKRA